MYVLSINYQQHLRLGCVGYLIFYPNLILLGALVVSILIIIYLVM